MTEESEHDRQVRFQKEIFDKVIHDWMDEQFKTFGKWSMRAAMVLLFSVLVHLMLAADPKAVQHILKTSLDAAQ